MISTVILEALFLGLVSSLHCAGMCGPLMLALPVQNLPAARRWSLVVWYHCGRILTYGLMGLVFGIAGRRIQLAGLQQMFSVLLGGSILISVIIQYLFKWKTHPRLLENYYMMIRKLLFRMWSKPGDFPLIMMGMVNGLLPCGMVYLAIAASVNTGGMLSGSLYMISFGLGTLPMLLAVTSFRFLINSQGRTALRNAVPVLTACLGILLVLRGLDLGIPFISPVLAAAPAKIISCH
jgi:sulfite exporter TauE/SafE